MEKMLFVIFYMGLSLTLQAQSNVPKQDVESRTPPPTLSVDLADSEPDPIATVICLECGTE